MNNIKDLNIQSEILPLFDFTLNSFAKEALLKILQEPLSSTLAIEARQNIIKGFILNLEILSQYTYSRPDFIEVHRFLTETNTRKRKMATFSKFLAIENERQRHKQDLSNS